MAISVSEAFACAGFRQQHSAAGACHPAAACGTASGLPVGVFSTGCG